MSARLPTMKCQFLVRMQVGAASALQATTTRLPRAQESHLPSAAWPRRSLNKRGSELRCKTDSGIYATAPLSLGLRRRYSSSMRIFAGGMPHHILWPNSVGGTCSDTESRHASVGFVVGLPCFDQTTQRCFLNPPPRVFKSASGEPPEAARAMLVSSRSAPR